MTSTFYRVIGIYSTPGSGLAAIPTIKTLDASRITLPEALTAASDIIQCGGQMGRAENEILLAVQVVLVHQPIYARRTLRASAERVELVATYRPGDEAPRFAKKFSA